VRGTHLSLSCIQHTSLPVCTEATLPISTGDTNYNLLFLLFCSRTSSARDAIRSLLHSTHTSTSLYGGHATRLLGGAHTYIVYCLIILCSKRNSALDSFRTLWHSTHTSTSLHGGCHPDAEPCRNIWRRSDWGTSMRLYGGTLPNSTAANSF